MMKADHLPARDKTAVVPQVWRQKGAVRPQRRRGVRGILNAAPAQPLSDVLCQHVDMLAVNTAEAAQNLAIRFRLVIVTAGAKGLAPCVRDGNPMSIPAKPA